MSGKISRTRRIRLPFASVDDKPYIFASYGHDDKEVVFPLLKKIYEAGYNVWYDEGITIGESYDEVIESHIRQSAVFLLFTSNLSISRPYVTEVEIKLAYENRNTIPVLQLNIEGDIALPAKTAALLPQSHFDTVEQVLDKLRDLNIENFGERIAVPVEREVPLYWLEGHDLDPASGGKNNVYSKEEPYACLAFDPDDLPFCNPYAKELYFAGYNVRSCENCTDEEREEMIANENCMAYVPFVTKKYIDSGKLEKDYLVSRKKNKTLIALYIPLSDKDGTEEKIKLPPSISKEFSHMQGLNLKELTNNDFLSKLENELEKRDCYSSLKDGKVERRNFEIKDFLYDYTDDKKGIILTKFRREPVDSQLNVEIRKSYGGYPVKEIGVKAFESCNNLLSVSIPDGVTTIGKSAFSLCYNLSDARLPDSLSVIGDWAFYACALKSVTIPDNTKIIGNKAFRECKKLVSITIPDSVIDIGDNVFNNCKSLVSVTIPKSVTRIGQEVFLMCVSLSSVTLPDSLASIPKEAFYGCKSLTTISIPNSVTNIEKGAFYKCSTLSSLIIPESVISIEGSAFYECTNLASVTLPVSLKSIGGWAFAEDTGLSTVYIKDLVSWFSLKFENGSSNPLVFANHLYVGTEPITDLIVPPEIDCIGDYTFIKYSGLTTVKIHNGVSEIGRNSFYGCTNLLSVSIPDSVTNIEEKAFSECEKLTVFCSEKSYAWEYCKNNKIRHKRIVGSADIASSQSAPIKQLIPLFILLALIATVAGIQLSGIFDFINWFQTLLG